MFGAISSIASEILAVEESPAALAMFDEIQQKTGCHFKMVKTVGPGAANTVLVGDTVVCSATLGLGSVKLEAHYKQHAKHVIPVDISEFHKVDGGLTCLSLLIER
jgi:dimethylargininase